jgi:hypothetical protein
MLPAWHAFDCCRAHAYLVSLRFPSMSFRKQLA